MDCRLTVTKEMVIKECESACGATPVQVRPNNVKEGQYTTSWIIHFKQKPGNLKFRLFEESGPTMPFTRRRPTEQCQKCWGFHATRACIKGSRCGRCTGAHEILECSIKVPKCSNCAEPHESTNLGCMARPRRQNGLVVPRTPSDLRVIRERGHRDFKVALAESEMGKGKAIEVPCTQEVIMENL